MRKAVIAVLIALAVGAARLLVCGTARLPPAPGAAGSGAGGGIHGKRGPTERLGERAASVAIEPAKPWSLPGDGGVERDFPLAGRRGLAPADRGDRSDD